MAYIDGVVAHRGPVAVVYLQLERAGRKIRKIERSLAGAATPRPVLQM
jgi:hypothetical protein